MSTCCNYYVLNVCNLLVVFDVTICDIILHSVIDYVPIIIMYPLSVLLLSSFLSINLIIIIAIIIYIFIMITMIIVDYI